jgi:hypothetical protein
LARTGRGPLSIVEDRRGAKAASPSGILNCFRQKPLDAVLPAARAAGVGIIARVPLASGLLSGRYDETTVFPADDHRTYNRDGEAFDVGETFSGVPFGVGVPAARELAACARGGATPAQFALRWVLDQEGVSVVIPGARSAAQARAKPPRRTRGRSARTPPPASGASTMPVSGRSCTSAGSLRAWRVDPGPAGRRERHP